MKKTYISPVAVAIEQVATNIMQASVGFSTTPVDASKADAKESFFNDEEEEE